MKRFVIILIFMMVGAVFTSHAQCGSPGNARSLILNEKTESITILWTSGDRNVFLEGIEPYCTECMEQQKHKPLTLIAWGPSVCSLAKNKKLQKKVASLIQSGLEVKASGFLVQKYGCKKELTEIGVEVGNISKELNEILMDNNRQLVSM
jgi:hypothetical protein